MKIYLENINLQSNSGPNSFAKKLLPQLETMGHSFTSHETADVALCFIEASNSTLRCPRILRMDGVYFNTAQDYKLQNQNIERTYNISDGVVIQSNFNKELIYHYFGEHKKTTVIHNGADINTIELTTPMNRDKYNKIWCCASSWRPHKRLEQNIKYFLKHKGENDLLIVAGNVKQKIKDSSITYLGTLNQIQLYSLYKASDYFIHLAWLDHCPNVVVDARACGCQIICSSTGGTKEIAGPDAIIIEEDKWDFQPIRLYEPPKLDFNKKIENNWNINIDMSSVAKKYENFLYNGVSK
jgi:glycosyltransferase involved in cell wall biosynthesis